MTQKNDLSEPEAARVLDVSLRTLQRYRKAGVIGFHRKHTGRIYYSVDQLTEYRTRCRVNPAD